MTTFGDETETIKSKSGWRARGTNPSPSSAPACEAEAIERSYQDNIHASPRPTRVGLATTTIERSWQERRNRL